MKMIDSLLGGSISTSILTDFKALWGVEVVKT